MEVKMKIQRNQPRRLIGLVMLSTTIALQCCDIDTDGVETGIENVDTTLHAVVDFTYFSGDSMEGGVRLSWGTRSETNCAGFNLFRKNTEESDFVAVNQTLIPSKSTEGSIYEYLDEPLDPGSYEYALEEVDNDGKTTSYGGTFTVTVFDGEGNGTDCSAVTTPIGRKRSAALLLFSVIF